MTTPASAPSAESAPTAFGQLSASSSGERELANLETARRYLAAIETGKSALAFFAPDVVQEEFPNRFVPAGARRGLEELREAAARGRAVLRGQRYEVRRAYAIGENVILEVLWVGTLAVQVGTLAPGQEMKAHFAVFLEFREGRIHRQRNYDCFEAF